jgi:hypothetical protein
MTLRVLVATLALGASLCASAADEGSRADATLEINGRAIRLTSVLVIQNGNEEGMEDAPRLLVFLSDKPIPLQAAGGPSTFRAAAWARNANVTAVVLRGDPAGKSSGGTASVLAAPGLERGSFASLSGNQAFKELRVGAGRASGTVAFDGSSPSIKGSFDAPITPMVITQDLKDRAAAESAPAKAYLAYMAALKKGDLKEAARYANPGRMQEIEQLHNQSAQVFKNMTKEIPDSATLAKSVRRVIVRGSLASVVLASKEVNELVRDGDDWKID